MNNTDSRVERRCGCSNCVRKRGGGVGHNGPCSASTVATDGDIRGRGAVAFEWEAVGGGHTSHVWYRARQAGARNREWSDRHKTLAFAIKDALEIANDG